MSLTSSTSALDPPKAVSFLLCYSPFIPTAAHLVTSLSNYRGEMDRLVSWCSMNNLELKYLKTVEMIVDFRKDPAPLPPVIVCDSPVSSVESFRFLATTITKELKWEQNIRCH
ncbi:hypothetical protein QTP86_003707 [Hemibagrus guttatus]|nr:hypothetical protein QTP86_003707 [Hemibagrus guttatus]